MAIPRVVLLRLILIPLEKSFWMLLDADSDSVGLGLGWGLCMSDKLPCSSAPAGAHSSWDQDELLLFFQISSPSTKLSWHLPCSWAYQWYLAWSQTSCDFFFFSFAVNTSVNVWFNKNKYLYLSTYCVCQALHKAQRIQSRPGAKVFSGSSQGCASPLRWLRQVISLKNFSFTLVLLERRPFQKFCIHCSFSSAFISPPLFACQMHRELPDLSTKKLKL